MQITVSLITILKRYASDKIDADGQCDVPDDSSLADLAAYLGIPGDVVNIYLQNGKPAQPTSALHHGDQVKMFSFLGGG